MKTSPRGLVVRTKHSRAWKRTKPLTITKKSADSKIKQQPDDGTPKTNHPQTAFKEKFVKKAAEKT